MIAEILHVSLPIAAFVAAIYVERHKARIMSVVAFWSKDHQLEGTYVARWTIDAPPGSEAKTPPPPPFDDYIEIEWAAGGYAVATGTNAKYGKYRLCGKRTDDALTLSYDAADKAYSKHIGVVLLRVMPDGTLEGNWSQNRPDLQAPQGGSTKWTKRNV